MLSTASKLLRTVHSVFRLSPTPVSFFSLPVPLSLSARIAESFVEQLFRSHHRECSDAVRDTPSFS